MKTTRWVTVAAVLIGTTALAQSELGVEPDVEVEVRMLQFKRETIEAASRTSTVDRLAIEALFKSGQGELLAAPVVRTRPGTEASFRGVTEYIYPTSFEMQDKDAAQDGTNDVPLAQGGSSNNTVREASCIPMDFATREVGTILTVLPEISADRRAVRLTLSPQCVFEPVWRSYGFKKSSAMLFTPMEQPFFPVVSLSTQVSLAPGSTVLIGGGTPSSDGSKLFYLLATVRVLTPDANAAGK